ncbi:MAG: TMEM43 family protein [Candidatus Methylopumilus sp.]|nr:TMEM43 family protein [Candidatus Methylopumilus sp.]
MAELNNSITETTTTGWLSRMGSSLMGVLIGIILLPCAIFLLSWNEGRAVTAATGLKRGLSSIVEVSADTINPQNNSKLVYLNGSVSGVTPAVDPWNKLSATGLLRLQRKVEMYQWLERESETTSNNIGGSQTTQKTYTYSLGWAETAVNSAQFKVPAGHQNPAMPLKSQSFDASLVKIGAFTLDKSLVQDLTNFEAVETLTQAPAGYRVQGNLLYKGVNPDQPVLGDVRVTYSAIAAQTYSIAAQQNNSTLTIYQDAKNNYKIALIEPGVVSAQKLFADQASTEKMITWACRIGGFLLLLIGFNLIMGPLAILVAFLPFLQGLVGAGTFFIALGLAIPITLITIAIAWIASRPLIGGGILLLAVAATWAIRSVAIKKKATTATA